MLQLRRSSISAGCHMYADRGGLDSSRCMHATAGMKGYTQLALPLPSREAAVVGCAAEHGYAGHPIHMRHLRSQADQSTSRVAQGSLQRGSQVIAHHLRRVPALPGRLCSSILVPAQQSGPLRLCPVRVTAPPGLPLHRSVPSSRSSLVASLQGVPCMLRATFMMQCCDTCPAGHISRWGPQRPDSADARLRQASELQLVSCQLPCNPSRKLSEQGPQG